ncbi:MAG: hypothetical protein LBL43_08205 [Treponema sp.]|nr:hypothetical protein [Treponema sp.]
METRKTEALPLVLTVLAEQARKLKILSEETVFLGCQISRLADHIDEMKQKDIPAGERSNIIPFPPRGNMAKGAFAAGLKHPVRPAPIMARPGEPLPHGVPDYRPLLQRDGLILLSWAKRARNQYTAYWVTSTGIPRYYASRNVEEGSLARARPDNKSCAADDGKEYYGQKNPEYMVHVAPELIDRNVWRGEDPRPEHIRKLQALGSKADFNYRYLLTAERRKLMETRRIQNAGRRIGASPELLAGT